MAGYFDDTNSLHAKRRPTPDNNHLAAPTRIYLGSGAIADSIGDCHSNTYCYAHPPGES